MSLDMLIMFSGAFVALIPFLGFPLAWDNVILVGIGVLIIAFGIMVRRRGLMRRSVVTSRKETVVERAPRENNEEHAEG